MPLRVFKSFQQADKTTLPNN